LPFSGVTARQIEAGETTITLRFADTSDWIRTKSGEWLRGGVDWMRDDIMEFDSDEFGPLEIHMRDVAGVHAPDKDTYVFDDRTSLWGFATRLGSRRYSSSSSSSASPFNSGSGHPGDCRLFAVAARRVRPINPFKKGTVPFFW
jgi:hypothetical protein